MASIVNRLSNKNLISPPRFVKSNTQYEVIMGSTAYGVSDIGSDIDVYGFCIPSKDIIFPHLRGEIEGFGIPNKRFWQFQQHHINDIEANKEYDITIYNIVKYFQLLMENNPNIVDSLYVPRRCIIHSTQIGELVRENRHIFLHKGAWKKFRGYAYSQMHKISIKTPQKGSNREKLVKKHGYDTKFAYHVVRLIDEVEQILSTGTLILDSNREQLKSIRRGEWTELQIRELFEQKEKDLEKLYHSSSLPYRPDSEKIKLLLLKCLEIHYGNLSSAIHINKNYENAIKDIKNIIDNLS